MLRYKMIARDINSQPTQYRTWIVNGIPDLDGSEYTGLKSGSNNFADVTPYVITDDSVIADFNLPLPQIWYDPDHAPVQFDYATRKVLPEQVSDSQLAIIDGYAYLFGSKISDKIWRASINNPADWVDTGATLPTNLYGSQLAIVDGYIYLFGGNSGDFEKYEGLGAVDTIFSASVTDPLTWTNHGSLLPRRLFNSSLAMFDGQLYLFGGQEINSASDVIFTASTSNPLNWTDTGLRLPAKFYGATLGIFNGDIYLFGGQSFPDTALDTIYMASTTFPTSWSLVGHLPYQMSFCQLATFGGMTDGYAYLFGPGQGANPIGNTLIMRTTLRSPLIWSDVVNTVPGVISHSQIAWIYDRLWLFGGSGESAIFACWQELKYNYYDPKVVSYGIATRTTFNATDNVNEPFQALGMPYWKTDFGPVIL